MEISRKKISDEEIYESEKKLAEEATKISEDFKEKFSSIGFELETEFSRENENLTEEKRKELSALSVLTDRCEYSDGYISNVKITVKHPRTKSDEELYDNEEEELLAIEQTASLDADGDDESDSEQRKNDIMLARSKRELERSVAFTTLFLVRVYKTFWHETVSISDNAEEIEKDLSEFFEKLSEKCEEE